MPIKTPKKINNKFVRPIWPTKPFCELVILFKKKIKINKGIVIKKVTINEEIACPVLVLIKTAIINAMLVNKTKQARLIRKIKINCQVKIELIIGVNLKANNRIIVTKKINRLEISIKIKLKIDAIIKKFIFLILVNPIRR